MNYTLYQTMRPKQEYDRPLTFYFKFDDTDEWATPHTVFIFTGLLETEINITACSIKVSSNHTS